MADTLYADALERTADMVVSITQKAEGSVQPKVFHRRKNTDIHCFDFSAALESFFTTQPEPLPSAPSGVSMSCTSVPPKPQNTWEWLGNDFYGL